VLYGKLNRFLGRGLGDQDIREGNGLSADFEVTNPDTAITALMVVERLKSNVLAQSTKDKGGDPTLEEMVIARLQVQYPDNKRLLRNATTEARKNAQKKKNNISWEEQLRAIELRDIAGNLQNYFSRLDVPHTETADPEGYQLSGYLSSISQMNITAYKKMMQSPGSEAILREFMQKDADRLGKRREQKIGIMTVFAQKIKALSESAEMPLVNAINKIQAQRLAYTQGAVL
jgi:hypothetical protein